MFTKFLKRIGLLGVFLITIAIVFLLTLILADIARDISRKRDFVDQAKLFIRCLEYIRSSEEDKAIEILENRVSERLEYCSRDKEFEKLSEDTKIALWAAKCYFYKYNKDNMPNVVSKTPWNEYDKARFDFKEKYSSGQLKKAPDLNIAKWLGEPKNIEDFKGKVLLVDIWATGCKPCVKGMPKIQKLYEKYNSKGLEIIAIHHPGGDINKIEEIKNNNSLTFDLCIGSKQTILNYGIEGLPSYYIIDTNGHLFFESGYDLPSEEFVQKLLQEVEVNR
jgi:thiol-disulfide isomerase/thioredoxin